MTKAYNLKKKQYKFIEWQSETYVYKNGSELASDAMIEAVRRKKQHAKLTKKHLFSDDTKISK